MEFYSRFRFSLKLLPAFPAVRPLDRLFHPTGFMLSGFSLFHVDHPPSIDIRLAWISLFHLPHSLSFLSLSSGFPYLVNPSTGIFGEVGSFPEPGILGMQSLFQLPFRNPLSFRNLQFLMEKTLVGFLDVDRHVILLFSGMGGKDDGGGGEFLPSPLRTFGSIVRVFSREGEGSASVPWNWLCRK